MTQEELIAKAAELFSQLGLTSLKIDDKNAQFSIELGKEVKVEAVQTVAPIQATAASSPEVIVSAPESKIAGAAPEKSVLDAIKAPLVGVFYSAPSPDQPSFVRAGDSVKKGDIICIIEAMKMMNEITADRDCVIDEVCVENGSLVEFGQMLFKIKD